MYNIENITDALEGSSDPDPAPMQAPLLQSSKPAPRRGRPTPVPKQRLLQSSTSWSRCMAAWWTSQPHGCWFASVLHVLSHPCVSMLSTFLLTASHVALETPGNQCSP